MNTSLAVGVGVGVVVGWILRGRTRNILALFMKSSTNNTGKVMLFECQQISHDSHPSYSAFFHIYINNYLLVDINL